MPLRRVPSADLQRFPNRCGRGIRHGVTGFLAGCAGRTRVLCHEPNPESCCCAGRLNRRRSQKGTNRMKFYVRLFSLNLKGQMQYKFSFFLSCLGQFITAFTSFFSIRFIFLQIDTVGEFTYGQVLLCFSVMMLSFSIGEAVGGGLSMSAVQKITSPEQNTRKFLLRAIDCLINDIYYLLGLR